MYINYLNNYLLATNNYTKISFTEILYYYVILKYYTHINLSLQT